MYLVRRNKKCVSLIGRRKTFLKRHHVKFGSFLSDLFSICDVLSNPLWAKRDPTIIIKMGNTTIMQQGNAFWARINVIFAPNISLNRHSTMKTFQTHLGELLFSTITTFCLENLFTLILFAVNSFPLWEFIVFSRNN